MFNYGDKDYMIADSLYVDGIVEDLADKLVTELLESENERISGSVLCQNLVGLPFSEELFGCVYAKVTRKLIDKGYCLVCYPAVGNPTCVDAMNKLQVTVTDYIYQVAPIGVPDQARYRRYKG